MRNPKWTRDEVIVGMGFYFRHYPDIPDRDSDEIRRLSEILRNLRKKLGVEISDTFRNETGVFMKLDNYHHLNPDNTRKGLSSTSKMERLVYQEFADDKGKLISLGEQIEDLVANDEPSLAQDVDDDDKFEIQEGRLITRIHRFRERNRLVIERKKKQILQNTGELACEGCTFNFEHKYGTRGKGYIECHHTTPVSQIVSGTKTTLSDLSLVCSNCHRMIHRNTPWLSMNQLKEIAHP